MKSPDRIGLTADLVEEICALVDEIPLPEHYRAIIKTALRDYLRLGEAYAEKSHSIHRLLKNDLRNNREGLDYHSRAQEDDPHQKEIERPRQERRLILYRE